MISEGAEAKIYSVKAFENELVVKARESKRYRVRELDQKIRRERTRNEARIMRRLLELGLNIPKIYAVGAFSIYMERLQGKLLKDIKIKKENLIDAGNLLAAMHNNDISHGDFTPANLILSGNELYLIDFGLSEMGNSLEEKAIDLLLMKKSISKRDFGIFKNAYAMLCGQHGEIFRRLNDIELRGRYQLRTIS